jgi:hypothetical protein
MPMKTRFRIVSNLMVLALLISAVQGCKQSSMASQKPVNQRQSASVINSQTRFGKIDIRGERHKNGIYDISVEYGDDGVGWMAYSRIEVPKHVETRLAKSTDHGRTWSFVRTLNPSVAGTFKQNGKIIKGVWRYEIPALVYDRGDRPARRWKLFAQRIFSKPPHKRGTALMGESWIEYRYARSPQGPWSEPVRLLGTDKGGPQQNLNSLHADLQDMTHYTEIGVLEHQGILYMSLDAGTTMSGLGEWHKRKVILISSSDHGESWNYVGTLTDSADADDFGYLILTGTSLVREGNRIYLLATPSGEKGLFKNKGHAGLLAIEFADISRARLKRDSKGKLVVTKRIKPVLDSGGLSDYDEQNYNGGIIFGQVDLRIKSRHAQVFKAFNTGEGIHK